MQKYYVFLDIDGVMWDFKTIKESKTLFSKESLNALNFLLDRLMNDFDVTLVVTSVRRFLSKNIRESLSTKINGNVKIDVTPLKILRSKAFEVKEYLKGKPDNENILIIDDIKSCYKKYFNENSLIKTSLFKGCLNEQMTREYLNNNNI